MIFRDNDKSRSASCDRFPDLGNAAQSAQDGNFSGKGTFPDRSIGAISAFYSFRFGQSQL